MPEKLGDAVSQPFRAMVRVRSLAAMNIDTPSSTQPFPRKGCTGGGDRRTGEAEARRLRSAPAPTRLPGLISVGVGVIAEMLRPNHLRRHGRCRGVRHGRSHHDDDRSGQDHQPGMTRHSIHGRYFSGGSLEKF